MTGMLLGYSTHPNTLVNYSKQLVTENKTHLKKAIKEAVIVSNLGVLTQKWAYTVMP